MGYHLCDLGVTEAKWVGLSDTTRVGKLGAPPVVARSHTVVEDGLSAPKDRVLFPAFLRTVQFCRCSSPPLHSHLHCLIASQNQHPLAGT